MTVVGDNRLGAVEDGVVGQGGSGAKHLRFMVGAGIVESFLGSGEQGLGFFGGGHAILMASARTLRKNMVSQLASCSA